MFWRFPTESYISRPLMLFGPYSETCEFSTVWRWTIKQGVAASPSEQMFLNQSHDSDELRLFGFTYFGKRAWRGIQWQIFVDIISVCTREGHVQTSSSKHMIQTSSKRVSMFF